MNRTLLLLVLAVSLAGCVMNSRYVGYTGESFPAKDKYYFISIYPGAPPVSSAQPFRVIGRVEVSGHASDGVSTDMLTDQARDIARAKGADAIINARTEGASYGGVSVIPGHCGYYHCRPPRYIPYNDTLYSFRGELITFMPVVAQDQK